jgi:hypothetical protein
MATLELRQIGLINAADAMTSRWPTFLPQFAEELLRHVWVAPLALADRGSLGESAISFDRPLALSLPGLDAVQIALGAEGDSSIFRFLVSAQPALTLQLFDVPLSLRFKTSYLRPARRATVPGSTEQRFEVDPDRQFAEIILGTGTLTVNGDGHVTLDITAALDLPPVMIGDTGVAVEATGIQLFLADTAPPGKPAGVRGVHIPQASVYLPGGSVLGGALTITDAFIGNGGFSGTVDKTFTPPLPLKFFGDDTTLTSAHVQFTQNALVASGLKGVMKLPFFEKKVQLTLALAMDGTFGVTIDGVVPGEGDFDQQTGLLSLTTPAAKFVLSRMAFVRERDRLILSVAGTIQPTVKFEWPVFAFEDLSIDSDGNASFKGGWVSLKERKPIKLFAFVFEVEGFGFGRLDNGHRWIGFSGGLKLVDGVQAGGSVEGLRVIWGGPSPDISLKGVGLAIEIPKVLSITGKVSLDGQDFRGAVTVKLKAPELTFEGQFRTGEQDGVKFFGIFIDAQLPTGIPIASTGLGIYGFAGLFAQNMAPKKLPGEGWYRNPDFEPGWYVKSPEGVTDLVGKWGGKSGALGLGAGVTFGTLPDNGYNFNGRLLLLLSFPGPIIMLEGRANLFKKRAELTAEPLFQAIAILEPGRSFTFGLSAQYKYKTTGELLELGGSAEAFFDFENSRNWHIFLGVREPRKRIRGRLFKLFDVNAFFMLSNAKLEIGSGWGFQKSWNLGPLGVSVSASMEEEAVVSWQPNHFTGIVKFQGRADVRAFGHGVGISVGAQIKGDVFDPFHLRGDFRVGIDLPWPLPDISKTITLEWQRKLTSPPPLPLPLREISVEHPKVERKWLFSRDSGRANLIPNHDQGNLEWNSTSPPADPPADITDRSVILVVPADAKIGLTFSRAVGDSAPVSVNPSSKDLAPETIGDPVNNRKSYTAKYALKTVRLDKRAPVAAGGTDWVTVGRVGPQTQPGMLQVYGAWDLVEPQGPDPKGVAQSKLLLMAKSPFEYTGRNSQSVEEFFSDVQPSYPCLPPDPLESPCNDFEDLELSRIPPEFTFPDPPQFMIEMAYGGDITENEEVVQGMLGPLTRGLVVAESVPFITPPPPTDEVTLRLGTAAVLDVPPLVGDAEALANPYEISGADITISSFLEEGGDLRDDNLVIEVGDAAGIDLPPFMKIELEPAFIVELQFGAAFNSDEGESADHVLDLEWLDADGNSLGTQALGFDDDTTIRIHAEGIARVLVRRVAFSMFVNLINFYARRPAVATAHNRTDGEITYGPFVEVDGVITVVGEDLGEITLHPKHRGEYLLLELCLPFRNDVIIRHTRESLELFKRTDDVLEAEAEYRLVLETSREDKGVIDEASVVTKPNPSVFKEHAYFRTSGLPGIGLPERPPNLAPGPLGLEDLRAYVKQTVPPTVAPAGQRPILPRPVYRAYDQGVEFNANHVELMYRIARRDLTLRLFDGANEPVRDSHGRVMIARSRWGQTEDPIVKETTSRWIGMVNRAACRPGPVFDPSSVVKDQVLAAPDEGIMLAPDRLHQARLVPALLHEAFVNARAGLFADGQNHLLERWSAQNAGTAASRWEVRSETLPGNLKVSFVTETAKQESTLVYGGALSPEVNADRPGEWSDFRASVVLRWTSGRVGFVVRRSSSSDFLRVTLDQAAGTRRLSAFAAGSETVLAEDTVTFSPIADVELQLECIGDRVQLWQDGELIFDVTGAGAGKGSVGLYVKDATSPRFSDIRVDDLRQQPATAYAFDFVTSRYVNFVHHLHSYDEQSFPQTLASDAITDPELAALFAKAGERVASDADGERRAFETLADKLLGPAALRLAEQTEVIRILRGTQVIGFMVRSSEPILWDRITDLTIEQSTQSAPSTIPGTAKLISVSFSGATPQNPNDESVTLLIRESMVLTDHRLEFRALPSGTEEQPWQTYYEFGPEPRMADGTQVKVFACDPASGPAVEPGTQHRFVAATAAEAVARLSSPGVELRLVAPSGLVHQRVFPSPDQSSALDGRLLRKGDGTELVLVRPPTATAPVPFADTAQVVSLGLTFGRKITGKPTWRQGGSESDEKATLVMTVR